MKLVGRDIFTEAAVEVRFDVGITGVDQLIYPPPEVQLDWISPGWIDLQVNGFAGVDFNSSTASLPELARAIDAILATGVTRFFPTVITGAQADMAGALRNLAQARCQAPHGAAMEAFHVEGPYISPEDGPRGAHPREHVRPPDWDEFRSLQDAADGHIRLVTLSPEWPEAPAFIEHCLRAGIVVSIGHTRANTDQIKAAVDAGATLSTHLGNGAHAILPRHPNYLWDQLAEDRLNASFIVDDIHLGRNFLKAAIRSKGVERSVLVTDAVMPAGCSPGLFALGQIKVELKLDNRVVLEGQTRLAGSSLHMQDAISNAMVSAQVSLREAITMASRNPARVGRVLSRQRGLLPGERADLVKFRLNDGRVQIQETWLSGKQVYQRSAA